VLNYLSELNNLLQTVTQRQTLLTSHRGRLRDMTPRQSAHPKQNSSHKNAAIILPYISHTSQLSSATKVN